MRIIKSTAMLLCLTVCGGIYAEEHTLKEGVKDVGHAIGDAAHDIGKGTKKATKKVGHATKETATEIGHGTKKAAKTVGGAVKDAATETGHAFRDGAKELKDAAKGKGDKKDEKK